MKKVIVVGGGAAGMMAAGTAARRGLNVTLIEQNKILGKKLLITGKGRCNVTNACEDTEELIRNVPTNGSFLYSAFYGFDNHQTMAFFEELGVPLKVERGERVFPVSDRSADIVDALRRFLTASHVTLLQDRVDKVLASKGHICGVETARHGTLSADAVILATGGLSYPKTGSTGDGYTFAEDLGHEITDLYPSLVPIRVEESWIDRLQGLTLKNVGLTILNEKNKKVYTDFGEMMFAHFGLTGPIILSASAHMRRMGKENYRLLLDLKPALDAKQLDLRILRDFGENLNRDFCNSLGGLLPAALIPIVIEACGIDSHKKVNSVTKEERSQLVQLLKGWVFHPVGFCPIEQAIITSGGVQVREVNPSTMESKLVSGLFFAGELLDVDAYTGGFNLQIAFSTGHLAGSCC